MTSTLPGGPQRGPRALLSVSNALRPSSPRGLRRWGGSLPGRPEDAFLPDVSQPLHHTLACERMHTMAKLFLDPLRLSSEKKQELWQQFLAQFDFYPDAWTTKNDVQNRYSVWFRDNFGTPPGYSHLRRLWAALRAKGVSEYQEARWEPTGGHEARLRGMQTKQPPRENLPTWVVSL